jgi:hypothetical protein
MWILVLLFAAMTLGGIGLAIWHREPRGLTILLVPTVVGGLAVAPFLLVWTIDAWTIVLVLTAMVWATMFVAASLRVRFSVGFLLIPAAFAIAFFIWYMLVRR